jgi:poly(ribitol-phosphate) beta-N-acetylglucosaminyltransferase
MSRPEVSVVVPVFDPGEQLAPCVDSLLAQTLAPGTLELIFVDDGSTDGSGAVLDALAASHAHVRVEHIRNSGWPGKPRNVGLGLARGEYVFFADNDDRVAPDGLERLLATARQDDADVVVGKVVGHGKHVTRDAFARNLHGVRFRRDLSLLGLLTPHKLFRRAFLEEHELRYPEGRRRLEDHLFVVAALLRARRISRVADHAVYHWIAHGDDVNASYGGFEPEAYYANLEEVLDLVEAELEPGPFRDRVLAHWYRGKMLQRVGGRGWLTRPEAYRRELVDAVRRVALRRYADADAVHEHLDLHLRTRSRLLRAGSWDGLVALAELDERFRPRIELEGVRDAPVGGTSLTLRLRCGLRGLDLVREDERILWRLPGAAAAALGEPAIDVTRELRTSATAEVWLSGEDGAEWSQLVRTRLRIREIGDAGELRPVLTATVPIAPTAAAAGAPLPAGPYEVRVNAGVLGFGTTRIVRRDEDPLMLTVLAPGRIVEGVAEPAPEPGLRTRLGRRAPRAREAVRSLRAAAPAGRRA